jgi:general secretion pathway protein D
MSKAIAAILSWLALVVCPPPASAAPTITAGSATVGVGDTFTIQVSITGAQDLSAWQFDLGFDPTILRANLVSEGDLTLLSAGAINNGSGLIDDIAGSFMDAGLNGLFEGVLAVIEFEALAAGTSALTLLDIQLGFEQTAPDLENGSVTVNAQIPEPGTLALVVLATGGLALRRRQDRMGRPEAARRPIG